jgi:hypothetical protein
MVTNESSDNWTIFPVLRRITKMRLGFDGLAALVCDALRVAESPNVRSDRFHEAFDLCRRCRTKS